MHSFFNLNVTGLLIVMSFFTCVFCYWLHHWTKQKSSPLHKMKILDAPERWTAPKSNYGGVLIFIAFLIGGTIELANPNSGVNVCIYIAAILAFALGRWDDLQSISPTKKLVGQFIVASLMMLGDLRLGLISQPFDLVISILFVVALMNSFNMIDNMDAVSAIVAIGVFLFIIFYSPFGQQEVGADTVIVAAAVFAFLIFNWYPSKIFMGDSGTMFLGMFMAYLLMNNHESMLVRPSGWQVVIKGLDITAFTLLALPIVDTTVVVIQRLRYGVSPFQGGRDHTTHNLVYLGFSERQVAMLFILLTLISVGLALLFQFGNRMFVDENMHQYESRMNDGTNYIWTFINIVYILLLFLTMLLISFRNLRKGKYSYSKK